MPPSRDAAQRRAVLDRAAPDARIGQLAGVAGVHGLEHLRQRRRRRRRCPCARRSRRRTACRGAAPSTAGARRWRSPPHPAAPRSPRRPPGPCADRDRSHPCVGLMSSSTFSSSASSWSASVSTSLPSASCSVVLHLRGNLHQFGGLALAVAIGALADHIDIAGDRLAIDDRHLAQHQRRIGIGLQRRERVGARCPPACRSC